MSGPKGMSLSLRTAVTVAARDLLEFVRDRRTLVVTLLMPMAMYPVLALSSTLGVRTAVSDQEARRASARLAVVVSGAEAEDFAARLQTAAAEAGDHPAANVSIVPLPEGVAAERIAAGEADAWLVLPPGAVAGLDGDGTVEAEARLAPAVWNAGAAARVREQLMELVRGVADEARGRRVARAGLPRTLLVPISVRFAETARGGTSFRDVVPTVGGAVLVLLALLTATGAFYPAIDAIAGEKERGTIETLLVAPCRSADVVLGKFLAVLAVTLVTLATNALSIALTGAVLLRFLPEGSSLGLGVGEIAGCAAVAIVSYLGLAAIAAALCLAVTSAARSVKEAQNTLTPVILLVSGLAGAALLPGVSGTPLLAAVPFAGQVALARSMLVPPEAGTAAVSVAARLFGILPGMLVSMAASLGVVWILLAATAAAVSDEEILFRGPDSVRHGLQRPAARRVPSVGHGCAAMALALAALWYAQALAPDDLVEALPLHQVLVAILPLGLLSWWQRVDMRRTFRALLPGRGMEAVAACAAAAAVGVGLFLAGAWLMLVVTGGEPGPETRRLAERLLALLRQRPAWLVWLLVAVVPAVCEELFFRGWVLAAFAGDPPRSGRAVRAVVAQAACFALIHLLPERMPQTFALGLVLGWMTLRSGSILPAMVAHAAHNATPLVLHALCGAAVASGSPAGASGWMPGLAVACLAVGMAIFAAATGWRSAVPAANAA